MAQSTLTFNIIGAKSLKRRVALAVPLMRLAATILGTKVEIEMDGPRIKTRFKPGINSAPPVAYSMDYAEYNPEVGRRLQVTLNNDIIAGLVAYDTEEGWVEFRSNGVIERHTGTVAVAWKWPGRD